MSMAAGEYVSVSSQADIERSDLVRKAGALAAQPAYELAELTEIYVRRGLDRTLAAQVAAHARDELDISDALSAKPLQAAFASAAAFAVGAALPLAALEVIPTAHRIPTLSGFTLVCLCLLGYAAAKTGGTGKNVCLASRLLGSHCDGGHGPHRQASRRECVVVNAMFADETAEHVSCAHRRPDFGKR
jgi:VIT1/CCC1 family predicted Fe2+/Mn2+ transporter